jgi:hypothetical protein
MGKTNQSKAKSAEDQLMDLYDELASKWASKMEARRAKS